MAGGQAMGEAARREGLSLDEAADVLREAAARIDPGQDVMLIYIDGASRGNPGLSAAGAVLLDGRGKVLAEESAFLGNGTNNAAEYQALLLALGKATALGGRRLEIRSDSELLVNQLNGRYRVKEPRLQEFYFRAAGLMQNFADVRFIHVPREENRRADRLANKALDDYIDGMRQKS